VASLVCLIALHLTDSEWESLATLCHQHLELVGAQCILAGGRTPEGIPYLVAKIVVNDEGVFEVSTEAEARASRPRESQLVALGQRICELAPQLTP